jgi:cytolysin (calcineurin-like family phosphatase)
LHEDDANNFFSFLALSKTQYSIMYTTGTLIEWTGIRNKNVALNSCENANLQNEGWSDACYNVLLVISWNLIISILYEIIMKFERCDECNDQNRW